MKKIKLTYWISTGLFALLMSFSAFMYFSAPEMKANFQHLGFNDAFRVELGIAKFLGALALILPMVGRSVKEWAYAGFGITLISASIAHTHAGDPTNMVVSPLVIFLILGVSYFAYNRMQKLAISAK